MTRIILATNQSLSPHHHMIVTWQAVIEQFRLRFLVTSTLKSARVSSFFSALLNCNNSSVSLSLLSLSLSIHTFSFSLHLNLHQIHHPSGPFIEFFAFYREREREREIMSQGDMESRGEKNRGNSSIVIEERDAQWTSWLIPMFVVANIAVFVVAMYINNCPKHHSESEGKCVARFLGRFSFEPWRENPLLGPSSSTLAKLGALNRAKVVHKHQAWRLITCIWLHAGIIHLVVNMLSLIFIGIRLEQQFGFVRIGIIYLLSGIGGSILSSLFIENGISVGASGALFGLLGGMLSELITNWSIYSNKAAAFFTLLAITIIGLGLGILPRVDNFAHIGGFLTGFLLGFVLLPRPQYGWIGRHNLPADVRVRSKYKPYQYVLWLVSLALLVAGFTVGLVMLFRGVNTSEHCHWCHYLNCVPTDKWKCDRT